MDTTLDSKEKRGIIVQTGLQLIPYVGSAISTAYFSTKQAKEFKRLENFYSNIAEEVKALGDEIKDFKLQYEDGVIALIEKINYSIEKEHQQEKIDSYKKYFKETLLNPVTVDNYDKRRMFLEILNALSVLECKILSIIYKECSQIKVSDIKIDSVCKFEILGSLMRLQSYGLLTFYYVGASLGGNRGINSSDTINTNEYGEEFIKFIVDI